MFDLEHAIADWRRQMLDAGVRPPTRLDELESHLREDIAASLSTGTPEIQAFQLAVSRMGNPAAIRAEFKKVKDNARLPVAIGSWIWMSLWVVSAMVIFVRVPAERRGLLLSAHILSVILGYGAALLTGAFGIYYLCLRWFRILSEPRRRELDRAVFWFSGLSAGLVVVAVVLGMLWGKANLGQYMGEDPRVIGGLFACVWLVALSVVQWIGCLSTKTTMFLCVAGNVVVGLAWFGAGILAANPGMPVYRIGTYWPLDVFLAVHVLFLTAGFARKSEAARI